MRYWLIMMVLLVSQGCQTDEHQSAKDYFPLDEGLTWRYQVIEERPGGVSLRTFEMVNLGKVVLPGKYSNELVYVRQTGDGTDYYLRKDEQGIQRIAKRTVVELKPRYDHIERTVLPRPELLDKGQSWQVETQSFLLKGLSSHSLPDPSTKKFPLSYEVVATDETVEVPAGVFQNSLKVEATGVLEIYADPRLGFQEIKITQTEWYAPGVGLIKLIRNEPLDLTLFKGGRLTFELEQFTD